MAHVQQRLNCPLTHCSGLSQRRRRYRCRTEHWEDESSTDHDNEESGEVVAAVSGAKRVRFTLPGASAARDEYDKPKKAHLQKRASKK
jgi:hypothetical protein